jgi:hypothetical protein
MKKKPKRPKMPKEKEMNLGARQAISEDRA